MSEAKYIPPSNRGRRPEYSNQSSEPRGNRSEGGRWGQRPDSQSTNYSTRYGQRQPRSETSRGDTRGRPQQRGRRPPQQQNRGGRRNYSGQNEKWSPERANHFRACMKEAQKWESMQYWEWAEDWRRYAYDPSIPRPQNLHSRLREGRSEESYQRLLNKVKNPMYQGVSASGGGGARCISNECECGTKYVEEKENRDLSFEQLMKKKNDLKAKFGQTHPWIFYHSNSSL